MDTKNYYFEPCKSTGQMKVSKDDGCVQIIGKDRLKGISIQVNVFRSRLDNKELAIRLLTRSEYAEDIIWEMAEELNQK